MNKTDEKPKRLLRTLTGHFYELLAVYARTSAHKLPGAKGALREKAIANFVSCWVQKRFSVPTNVFATNRLGEEYPSELDLVIHDGDTGAVWELDSQVGNSVATWEEIRLIAQIKSSLSKNEFDSACKAMSQVDEFAKKSQTKRPFTLLFAYKVSDGYLPDLMEKLTYSRSDIAPFDAIILLEEGAYFSDSLRELRVGIEHGICPSQVRNDGPSQDRLILEKCIETRIPNGFRGVADCSPESALLSLAALATLVTAGDAVTKALLAACFKPKHSPIFE